MTERRLKFGRDGGGSLGHDEARPSRMDMKLERDLHSCRQRGRFVGAQTFEIACCIPKTYGSLEAAAPFQSCGNASLNICEKSFAALRPVSSTSSWLSVVEESPVAKFVMQENPATSIPSARA